MPVISINFTHEQYNALVEGARHRTNGNISEYLRKHCIIKERS